jgi:hypothetical protein
MTNGDLAHTDPDVYTGKAVTKENLDRANDQVVTVSV